MSYKIYSLCFVWLLGLVLGMLSFHFRPAVSNPTMAGNLPPSTAIVQMSHYSSSINTTSAELETANNNAIGQIFIGFINYLPVFYRP